LVIILTLVGLIATVWVWQNVHPVAGLVVGFLFVGGIGWQAVGFLIGLLRPSASHAFGQEGKDFNAAWEDRFGVLEPGGSNHPPSGSFQRWLRAKRSTGVSAGAWIDSQLSSPLEWINRPSDEETEDEGTGAAEIDDSSIIGWCEVLTDAPRNEYPLMMLKTEPDGITLMEVPGFSTFAHLKWADLNSWERIDEYDRGGNWVWLLMPLFDTDKLPHDVIGLAVREPSKRIRWEGLLEERIGEAFDEEE